MPGARQDAAIRQECALSSDIMKARKLRLEAQRQTQVNVSSVSFGEHNPVSQCDFEGSQPSE